MRARDLQQIGHEREYDTGQTPRPQQHTQSEYYIKQQHR